MDQVNGPAVGVERLKRGGVVSLFTFWGTRLYVDPESGRMRHGPSATTPNNLFLVACGTADAPSLGALFVVCADGWKSARLEDDRQLRLSELSEAARGDFAVASFDRIHLRFDGLYLSAEQDGSATASRPKAADWETFAFSADARIEASAAPALAAIGETLLATRRMYLTERGPALVRTEAGGRRAVICSFVWLSTFLASEHYHFVRLLQLVHGFDIIDSIGTNFLDFDVLAELSKYEVIIVAWQGNAFIPLNLLSGFKVLKIDDLQNYNETYDELLRRMGSYAQLQVGPYAYEFKNYFPHPAIEWIPYSTAIEEEGGQLPFNDRPLEKVLLSGSVAWDRPFRSYVFGLDDERLVKVGHPGYGGRYDDSSKEIVKARWYKELSLYLAAFCDGHSYRYIHLRVFEIASAGALLMADELVQSEMEELGFVHEETCIFCSADNFLERVSWVLDPANRTEVDRIRRAGMRVSLSRHTTRIRVAELVELIESRMRPLPLPSCDSSSSAD